MIKFSKSKNWELEARENLLNRKVSTLLLNLKNNVKMPYSQFRDYHPKVYNNAILIKEKYERELREYLKSELEEFYDHSEES